MRQRHSGVAVGVAEADRDAELAGHLGGQQHLERGHRLRAAAIDVGGRRRPRSPSRGARRDGAVARPRRGLEAARRCRRSGGDQGERGRPSVEPPHRAAPRRREDRPQLGERGTRPARRAGSRAARRGWSASARARRPWSSCRLKPEDHLVDDGVDAGLRVAVHAGDERVAVAVGPVGEHRGARLAASCGGRRERTRSGERRPVGQRVGAGAEEGDLEAPRCP